MLKMDPLRPYKMAHAEGGICDMRDAKQWCLGHYPTSDHVTLTWALFAPLSHYNTNSWAWGKGGWERNIFPGTDYCSLRPGEMHKSRLCMCETVWFPCNKQIAHWLHREMILQKANREDRREAQRLDVLICCFFSCVVGNFRGLCKQIDHFLEDTEYEADTAEYFLRKSAASFPLNWFARVPGIGCPLCPGDGII